MKADLSRVTFDRANHYKRVPLQQGRAQTDADANEQQAITVYRIETGAADLIGGCGGPIHAAGFAITPDGDDLLIGPGRYYVDGVLCENEEEVTYSGQPDWPLDPGFLADLDDPPVFIPPGEPGLYLVYLDVWERHLTALEAPSIREVALGGPDTATRVRTVWQVKLHLLGEGDPEGDDASCLSSVPSWEAVTAPSTGQMGARAEVADPSDDPCIVAPGAGYRRLENQLYRVEVHEGGPRNASTFKWDRDNGTILARLETQSADLTEWTVSSAGRDSVLRFAPGDLVELTDDTRELHGLPGTLVRVDGVEGDVLTIDAGAPLPAGGSVDVDDFPSNPKVRRWNGVLEGVTNQDWRDLEDGVQVRLRGGNGADGAPRRYRTGDYWTIPARTNTGDVEWPGENDGWRPPAGIEHHYCRLALLDFGDGGWGEPSDCRTLFPPVTELTSLFYVSGDGQQAAPDAELPHPLQVGVANGSHPVEGARVRFTVREGGGEVDGQPEVEVATGADGTVAVEWRLGGDGDQRVEAVLLDAAGETVHLPIRFVAEFETGDDEPGLRVTDIRFGTGDTLRNDADVPVSLLGRGITVECDADVAPGVVRAPEPPRTKPVCYVTLHLPWPLNRADVDLWGDDRIGTRPLRLDAELAVDDNEIFWRPGDDVVSWLNQRLFQLLSEVGRSGPVLAYLTLEGDFIWAEGDGTEAPVRYLDGELFGRLRDDGGTDAVLPSGDRRRGGRLRTWFRLTPGEDVGEPDIAVEPGSMDFGTVVVGGSAERTVVVTNLGEEALEVDVSVADPEGRGLFGVVSAEGFTVEPDGSQTVVVRFAPDEPEAASDRLVIDSDDPDTPRVAVPLGGVGQAEAGTALVQLVHNAIDTGPVVFSGAEGLDADLQYREATPYRPAATGTTVVQVLSADGAAIQRTLELQPDRAYVLITCRGPDGLGLVVFDGARLESDTEMVEFFVASGLPFPVDVLQMEPPADAPLATDLSPCGRTGYHPVEPVAQAVFALLTEQGEPFGVFALNLSGHEGRTLVVLASGAPASNLPGQEPALIAFDTEGSRLDGEPL